MKEILSSASRDSFVSSFLFCMFCIGGFLALLRLLEFPGVCVHPSLVFNFKGVSPSLSSSSIMLDADFLEMFFIKLRTYPCIPSFLEVSLLFHFVF